MIQEHLIIFTRYPQPGQTKTRLIPILGEKEAAQLQRQMTEKTLTMVRKVRGDRFLSIVCYFTGADEELMRDWLGTDLTYHLQAQGDLGERMYSAFQDSFSLGMERVVLIGSDCPELSETLIIQAFAALKQQDLVLGPAVDGGYYLIGLSHLVPELFTGIAWGTSQVFKMTQLIAQQLVLSVFYLPVLYDIDRPEDLQIWDRVRG